MVEKIKVSAIEVCSVPEANFPNDTRVEACLAIRYRRRQAEPSPEYSFIVAISGKREDIRAILKNNHELRLLPSNETPRTSAVEEFFAQHKDWAFVTGSKERRHSYHC